MKILHISIILTLIQLSLCAGTFTAYGQIQWTKNADNPVLKRDTVMANLSNDLIAISDGWVVKEGSVYKIWYTCGGLNYPEDTLLRARLCYATSTDGIYWTKYSGNPVLDVSYNGGWDSLGVETATVIIDSLASSGERYKMWYAGQYYNSYRYDLGYAVSPDGISWTRYPDPVLMVGDSTQWDNGFLEGPSVLKEGGTYKMWYCGYDARSDGDVTDGHANIGYATSTDGIHWIKYADNPVVVTDLNAWDSVNVQDPQVIRQDNQYYMWYGGGASDSSYDQQVGFATSTDGINWNKSFANPVLARGDAGAWDATLASFPAVLKDDGMYKMWYTGKDKDPTPPGSMDYYWEIGYATAPASGISTSGQVVTNPIDLFPNPAQQTLHIQLFADMEYVEMKIYDHLGRVKKSFSSIDPKHLSIEIDDLANGLYFLLIQNKNEQLSATFVVAK